MATTHPCVCAGGGRQAVTLQEAKSIARHLDYNERGSFAGSSVTRGEFDVVQRRPRAGFRQRSPARELDELLCGHYTGSIINTSPRR